MACSSFLTIKVTPNASKTEIKEINDSFIKISLKAKPIENAANIELIRFLSKHYNISKNNIKIKSGKTSKIKLVEILADLKKL